MESNGKGGFIDRSKVRILLCDNDIKSSQEVFTLLLKCSYQVTSVRSARQVIDALNAEGPDIDIILAEVDLPMNKGIKMLKYVTRDKELRRIPVIMMSAQDEVSTVVKCLRLGAADYLLKPLRTNELLNLWTHMWRRRRMIGLGAKNILYYDVDPVASDPSDANTNSTTLFSDGTDDKSLRSTNVEKEITVQREDVPLATFAVAAGTEQHCKLDIPGTSNHQKEQLSCGPKKTELKIGVSSAFFTYKSSSVKEMHNQEVARNETAENIRMVEKIQVQLSDAPLQVSHNGTAENIRMVENIQVQISDAPLHERAEAWESQSQSDDPRSSSSILDSLSLERSSTPPASVEFRRRHFGECQHNGSGLSTPSVYQYFTSGIRNQLIMPAQLCEKSLQELRNHTAAAIMNQYNQIPRFPHQMTGMTPYSHYPAGICSQPGQVSIPHSWPSPAGEQANKVADRREAALIKFRQKRKERCFDKKIRYVNRKKLAEKRPRVRGQFVRKVNGINVDLNGHPASINYDEDEDEQATSDSTQGHNITGS